MRKEKQTPTRKRNLPEIGHFFDDFWPMNYNRGKFGFFDEFEEQFQRMEQRMHQLYNNMLQEDHSNQENPNMHVYGWTYRVGPDGQPHFQEFGNMPHRYQNNPQKQIQSGREPLIDLQEGEKEIYITAELPGVTKKEITLETVENVLHIEVNNEQHPYYKEIVLPAEINENKTEATYNNGVLSITLEKIRSKKKGKKINIK